MSSCHDESNHLIAGDRRDASRGPDKRRAVPICNLYPLARSEEEITRLAGAMRDLTGNLPPLPGIYPDTLAPIVRTTEDGVRELAMLRWGFPPPPKG